MSSCMWPPIYKDGLLSLALIYSLSFSVARSRPIPFQSSHWPTIIHVHCQVMQTQQRHSQTEPSMSTEFEIDSHKSRVVLRQVQAMAPAARPTIAWNAATEEHFEAVLGPMDSERKLLAWCRSQCAVNTGAKKSLQRRPTENF